MLRVVLHNADGTYTDLDTKEVSLQLNFASTDVSVLGSSKSAHSLAFKLPFSDVNNEALGFFDLVDQSAETRITRDCDIYDEGQLVLAGKLSIRSCDLQSRTYDCVVYARDAGVWQLLKASTWRDVFTYEGQVTTLLDHNHNAENVQKSNWPTYNDVTDGSVGNDIIWYPLQYAVSRNTAGEAIYPALYAYITYGSTTRIIAKDFLPSIQVKYLLEQVFAHCGYELNTSVGVFANVNLGKVYQTIPRENLAYRPYFQPRVSLSQNNGVAASGYYEIENLPNNPVLYTLGFTDQGSGDIDVDDFFQTAGGAFVPPTQGTYNMRLYMEWEFDAVPSVNKDYIVGVLPWDYTLQQPAGSAITYVANTSDPFERSVDFQFICGSFTQSCVVIPLFTFPTGATGIRFLTGSTKLVMDNYVGDSPKLNVPNSLGNETVDKWLKAIMTQFNLVLTLNNDNQTCVLHEKKNFYESDVDNAKDWTGKVDRGKAMTLTNNLEHLFRDTLFTDADGDDGKSLFWQDTLGKKYTDYTYKSGVALAQPSATVGGYFAPARYTKVVSSLTATGVTYQEDSPIGVQAFIRDGTISLNKKPMLIGRGDQITWPAGMPGYRLYNDLIQASTNYVGTSTWSRVQPHVGNILLSWASKTSYDPFGTNLLTSLFQYAYGDEMRKKYSKDARNLECEMWLDPLDITNLSYGDLITIDGVYYHIEAINNYVVGTRKSCKVKLNKLLDVESVDAGNLTCRDILVGEITAGGSVVWVDRDGVEVTGTQACCEFYGGGEWTWNAATSMCHTGAVEWEEGGGVDNFRALTTPNPQQVFDPQQTDTIFYEEESQGVEYRFRLTANTKGHTPAQAVNSWGEDTFYVPQSCVAAMKVLYVAKVTSDTDFGAMEFGEIDATYRVEGKTIVKVHNDGTIVKNGDVSSAQCVVSATYATGAPSFTIDCTGHTGLDMSWTIDVTMTLRPLFYTPTGMPQAISLQDNSNLVTEGDELMAYEV